VNRPAALGWIIAGVEALLIMLLVGVGVGSRGARPVTPAQPEPSYHSVLGQSARAYISSFERAMRESVVDVRSGKLKTKAGVLVAIQADRDPAKLAFGKALDQAFNPLLDAAGNILDAEKAATVLEEAAEGMAR
jgi:hypothetical protein